MLGKKNPKEFSMNLSDEEEAVLISIYPLTALYIAQINNDDVLKGEEVENLMKKSNFSEILSLWK